MLCNERYSRYALPTSGFHVSHRCDAEHLPKVVSCDRDAHLREVPLITLMAVSCFAARFVGIFTRATLRGVCHSFRLPHKMIDAIRPAVIVSSDLYRYHSESGLDSHTFPLLWFHMATLATTVETYVTYALRRRSSVHSKLPAVHDGKADTRSVTPPGSLTEVSDLTFHSPLHLLSFLRLHVLAYLADLETHLSSLEPSHIAEELTAKGELEVEEVKAWVKAGLEKLARIRSDVLSHLPECHACKDGSEHGHTASIGTSADSETVPSTHGGYVSALSEHLQSLQAHLSSFDLPSQSFALHKPHASVHELIDLALAPKFTAPKTSELAEANAEIARALEKSANGAKLLEYKDLPTAWKHHPFVTQGYRYMLSPYIRGDDVQCLTCY